jgi:hypothetical protein
MGSKPTMSSWRYGWNGRPGGYACVSSSPKDGHRSLPSSRPPPIANPAAGSTPASSEVEPRSAGRQPAWRPSRPIGCAGPGEETEKGATSAPSLTGGLSAAATDACCHSRPLLVEIRGASVGVRLLASKYTCQRRFFRGSLLLINRSPRYSSTAALVVSQSRPILRALSRPRRARSARCSWVIPLIAAASESEMNSSFSKRWHRAC